MKIVSLSVLVAVVAMAGCSSTEVKMGGERNFGQDVAFLKQHADAIVLTAPDSPAAVAVVPAYQGRVMTSSADGDKGFSFGWINYDLIASSKPQPHITPYGGEDRFWMGPEGGQFAIFFPKGAKFVFDDWQTPAVIDTEPFNLVSKTANQALFAKKAKLVNYSGTELDIQIRRSVQVLDRMTAAGALNVKVPDSVKMVTYESNNALTNAGSRAWDKQTGLLSIWILGMFKPSDQTTVVIPFVMGPEEQLGPQVNDAYFGKVPAERLVVKDGVLFFSGDGKYRSKIGLSPSRAKPILGSYDAANGVLTIVQYTKPTGAKDYVNSMWQLQDQPFAGDVANSYNDGPAEPGKKPLGPFYELESSSPAPELKPGESIQHVHRTFHLVGPADQLDGLAKSLLGVGLKEIQSALPK
jgi:hypothetical protein